MMIENKGGRWFYIEPDAEDALDMSDIVHGHTSSFGNNSDYSLFMGEVMGIGGEVIAESWLTDDGDIVFYGKVFAFKTSALEELKAKGETEIYPVAGKNGYYSYHVYYGVEDAELTYYLDSPPGMVCGWKVEQDSFDAWVLLQMPMLGIYEMNEAVVTSCFRILLQMDEDEGDAIIDGYPPIKTTYMETGVAWCENEYQCLCFWEEVEAAIGAKNV